MTVKCVRYFIFFLLVSSCVEPYSFVIDDELPTVVIEGFISDKSFRETLLYPSDGRYFSVKLTYTTDVTNVRPEPIHRATVLIVSDLGNEWHYSESDTLPGV